MDTEPTIDEQLLAHSKRQTAAQESMRGIALVWSVVAVIAVLTWVFFALAR